MHLIYRCDHCNCSFSSEEICKQHEEKCKPPMSVVEKRMFIKEKGNKIFNRLLNDTSACLTDIVTYIRQVNTNDEGIFLSNDIQASDWGFESIFEMLVEIDSDEYPREIETGHITDRCLFLMTNYINRKSID